MSQVRLSRRSRRVLLPGFLLGPLLAACGSGGAENLETARQQTIGLYSSLPIAWNESSDIRGLLADDHPPHWALRLLRDRGKVVPLDSLADATGKLPLPLSAVLVLAQPRPLTPQENVALDAWVRQGGRVLLFVDPLLTADSLFGPGDPRRPQDVAMMSPILARWGLGLEFDEAQPAGEREAELAAGSVPINLAGRFRTLGKAGEGASGKTGDAVASCDISAQGLLAECLSGRGRIVAFADAALLESPENPGIITARRDALAALLSRLTAAPR